MYKGRYKLLRLAYERSNVSQNEAYIRFVDENSWWLKDYALFMSVKDIFDGNPWNEWAEDIRLRYDYAMDYYRRECYFDIEFHQYMQFKFYEQWMKLKSYANYNGENVAKNSEMYDVNSPILCGYIGKDDKITERKVKSLVEKQISFFDLM